MSFRAPSLRYAARSARVRLLVAATVLFSVVAVFYLIPSSRAVTNGGSITTLGSPLTENFDSLAQTGTNLTWTDNSTIPGWYSTRTTYNTGTGSSNTGALYSFGVAGTNPVTDRALGTVASGTTLTIYQAVRLTNNTGSTITSLDINYNGEQWRNGGNTTAHTLTFQYQVANAGTITGANSPSSGWTTFSSLSFTGPVATATAAALDGNAPANKIARSATLSVTVNAGQEIWLRWQDPDDTGSDHGLAIDDFSVTANGVPPSPTPTPTPTPTPPPNNVVISQVYGGGGNTGATLKNDYIELINHSNAPVNLDGWSVQAFVSSLGTWEMTPLSNFTLQPGQYYLIQESQGAGGTDNLPTPDATGTILVSSTSTKVALVNNQTTITAACPDPATAGIVDLVGYGATDCFEGAAPAATLDNTSAALRRNEGCFDTNQNANDFVTGSPNPRNSSSPTHDCTSLSAYGTANPSSVLQGGSSMLTVYVAGAQNPDSTGITVTADLSQIGGSPTQSFAGSGSVFTFNATVPANNSTGMKSLPVTVSDAQSRTTNTNILLSVLPLIADHITISQVYGGGGNSGATFTNDYVELYNPTASTVTVTGWSLQYASAAGTSWTNKQPIGGVIGPGEYYLVALASGGVNGAPLPVTPNISGDINMSATTGKIALVSNSANLSGGCPLGADPDIVDFVGYGTSATCHEGSANTPAPNNSTAIFRKNAGALDADQNGTDFQTGTPNPRRTAPIVELGPWVSGTDPGTDDNTIPYDATITVNFSEPVTVDSGWYNITCSVTGSHNSPDTTEAHTSDLKTYAVTPNASFQFGEQCTVTITKTAVHDVDLDDSGDDTDTLFDDYTWSFTVVDAGQAAPYPPSVHLTMGNPSGADAFQPLNYLMEKPTYSLSYNNSKGTPNWVSWHLEPSWYGTLARVDTFRPDPRVDPSWYRVQAFDYAGSGFDRGHMTPNADRDNQNRIPINQETYLMSNMVPQAPDNNQGPWAAFEGYLRTQSDAGNEIYIVSGPNGVGGTGSNGSFNTIANGHVTVPASTWKVALVLPQATGDDVARVTCSTRTIAVLMPNVQGIRTDPWQNFLTTVDAIEQLTGYDFYSNLPPAVQACVEAGTNGTNPPGTANQSANTQEDTPVEITLEALRSNNNTLTFSIVSAPSNGSLGTVSAAICSGGGCTATVTYTPGPDYNGSDSFTFRASDDAINSNTSSVNIGITEVNDTPTADSQSVSTNWNTPLAITLTGSDVETQSASLTYTVTFGPSHGSLSGAGANRTYTPALNYSGPDSFKFTVTDTGDGSAPPLTSSEATVSITVNCPQLTSLGPASVWLGLKNSDDVGTKFDLLAEVLKNGSVVGSGQISDVPGGSSGFSNAVQRTINESLSASQGLCPGDTLSIRLSVRVAASSGHVSGTARLWFNDSAANSNFTATISGSTNTYYLRSGFVLATTPGPGPKSTIDVLVNRNQGGNPFKPFGTWTIPF